MPAAPSPAPGVLRSATLRVTVLVASALVGLLIWCCRSFWAGGGAVPVPTVAIVPPPPVAAAGWRSYPTAPPSDDWAMTPLDDARWVQVSADLACAGRANHGDPEAHQDAARRILFHHHTDGRRVMDYGIAVNQDAERAVRLGTQVADAAVACP